MKKLLIFAFWGLLGTSVFGQTCNCSGLFTNSVSAPIPTLAITGSMSAFSTTSGTPSTAQTVTVSGTNLTAGCTVTAPTGFEVSLDNSSYAGSKSISQSGTGLASQPVTVYTRLAAADAAGSYSGNVSFASTGATTQTTPVSGSVSSGGGSRTSHFMEIDIPNTSVSGGSNLSNYPLTFQSTSTNLKTAANGGFVQNSSGFDILFAADSFGTTLYKWEVEKYVASTGAITAHVKIPTLSASATTKLYIIYDSSSISTFQGGTAGSVWDANYLAVWHYNENITAASQTVHDYTTNGNNFTTGGTWAGSEQQAGQVGGALQLTGSNNDYFGLGSAISLTSDWTVEGWYFVPGSGAVADVAWWLSSDDESSIIGTYNGGYFTYFLNNGGNTLGTNTQMIAGSWHYFVFTRTGTTGQAFHDGTWEATAAVGFNSNILWNASGFGGTDHSGGNQGMDENRVSNIVRTNGWISTTYSNQSAPSSFYSLSAQH